MQILIARKRIAGTLPFFEYCALVPFDQISVERQNRISYRSNFGYKGELWVRLPEVIAPMDWLRSPPSVAKHETGKHILRAAKRIETVLVRANFPEMTKETVPIIFQAEQDYDDTLTHTHVGDLVDWFSRWDGDLDAISAESLGLLHFPTSRAA